MGRTEETFEYDNLLIPGMQHITGRRTIKSGQGTLLRGQALGKITATKKLVVLDTSAGDGSQIPFAILVDDTDTTSDIVVDVYLAGSFNRNVVEPTITLGSGDDIDNVIDDFADRNIYLQSAQSK